MSVEKFGREQGIIYLLADLSPLGIAIWTDNVIWKKT
jgi:hypothetical protein